MARRTVPGLMQETPLTIRPIFERLRTVYADGEIVSPERRYTYGEAADRILRLCAFLADLGVGPGDRVASFAHNTARHFELYYAVPLLGAVLHTINVRLFGDEIAYVANHAGDKVLFFDPALGPAIAELRPKLDTVEAFVELGDESEARIEAAQPIVGLPELDERAACGLCYTSGTTGRPKGVLYSHRAVWLHSMATCMADHIGIRETDRILPIVPLFHALGWGLPYAAPFTGAELVFHGPDNSPEHIGRTIEAERVTVSGAVPTIWKTLLPLLQDGKVDASTLRLVFVGGSASPRPLISAYDELGIEYLQVWGMTETGPLACASRPRRRHRELDRRALLDVREKTGTIFSGLEARIVDDDGRPLPWDGVTVGELEVRGPWIASAYYGDKLSDARFHEGWLRTGDMAWMEPDGYFRIVDRFKDLVKSGGEWISTVELEGLLLAHPRIRDAAVVGVRSRTWDERPVAVVVPAGSGAPSVAEVREYLRPRVAKWWLPDTVVTVDEIPKTSVGKIDKKRLRDQLRDLELP
ncbi:MAG: long-chain fatty acid--CoA ligase [Acidimicrobiales bacterium]